MVDLDAIKRVFADCHNIYEFGYSTRPMLGEPGQEIRQAN